MEIILAIVVASAVIFFGALITLGSERQRKAIDGLREQLVHWALQDLQIKRKRLVYEVNVNDPLGWLNTLVENVSGESLGLVNAKYYNMPSALVCDGENGRQVIFSPLSWTEILRMQRKQKNKLSRIGNIHPLLNLPRKVDKFEITILNENFTFEMELQLVWRALSTEELKRSGLIWIYIN